MIKRSTSELDSIPSIYKIPNGVILISLSLLMLREDNKITVSKANIKYYILPGGIQTFDPITFFEDQDLIISSIN